LGQLCFIWFVNEISRIFGHMLVLFYADEMKLFLPVHGVRDCLTIQNDLNRLAEWCDANALELNVGKCKLITFCTCCTQRKNYVKFTKKFCELKIHANFGEF
jgi:hypothetical protein